VRWTIRIVLALIAFVVVVAGYVAGHIMWVAGHDSRPHSDAIVVLGASQYNGTPSPVFAARLDHAKALYDAHVASRIVTVGGNQPGDITTEAQAGQDYLVRKGVPSNAILPVRAGHDTLQSVRAVADVFKTRGWKTAVLVTDPWHCLRARTMARDSGIDASTSPEHTGPAVGSFTTNVHYIARETLAYVYYSLFGDDNVHSTGAV
jgi:vancomycin permeability regulator SanA